MYLIIIDKKIQSSFKAVDDCVKEVISTMKRHETLSDEGLLFKVSFVLRELMNNSVEHGNQFDISKSISCVIDYSNDVLSIEVSDEGKGFVHGENYYKALDQDMRERRRGLKLIEELEFRIEMEHNTIRLNLDVS